MNTLPDQNGSVREARGLIWGGHIFAGLFGVMLPLAALVFELLTGLCEEFFDPIPTEWHVAAIALVVLGNGFALYAILSEGISELLMRWVARLNLFVMGIAAFYALWFIPLTPFAAIGIIFYGLGLLPLSPLLSLMVAIFLRRGLQRRAGGMGLKLPKLWSGLLAGFACLVAMELPGVIQAWAINTTIRGSEVEQTRTLFFLRHAGNEAQLLRGCYTNPDQSRAAVQQCIFGETSQTDRRLVYYRVTGRNYSAVPAPSHTLNLFDRGSDRGSREWIWDDGQGGGQVGQRIMFLDLKESRIDGTLDGDTALGYLEWTMIFRNDHEFQQREARALIQLPPGAVVSRLTLWIEGDEREAAFGGRGQVRQAYQAVVNQRRDPVLVTSKGADRVLLQCFPVAPKGGEMKVRIGITVPLAVDDPAFARLALPRIIEQNFSAAPGLSHSLWIEAKSPLSSGLTAYHPENSSASSYALRGTLSPAQFVSPAAGLTVARNPAEVISWVRDPKDTTRMVIQEIAKRPPFAGPLTVVLDGSLEMNPKAQALADALEAMPAGFDVRLYVAGDKVLPCPSHTPHEVAVWLREQRFTGGQDSSPALKTAFDSLAPHGGTLLWVHGTQSVAWHDTNALEQAVARRTGQVHLFALSAAPGANVILERLEESTDFIALPNLGEPKEDFLRALHRLYSGGVVGIRRTEPAENFMASGEEASTSLARLWAAEEVTRLLTGPTPQRDVAIRLAVAERLVTAVTGAVVLETKQQYDTAGLTPANSDPETAAVPDVAPTIVLLGIAMLVLGGLARFQQLGMGSAVAHPAGQMQTVEKRQRTEHAE